MEQETRELKEENRKIFYFIFAALLVMGAFVFKFYYDQRKENSALKIKIMTLNRTRQIVPWQRTMAPAAPKNSVKEKRPASGEKIEDQVRSRSSSTVSPDKALGPSEKSEENLNSVPTDELARTLNSRMTIVQNQDEEGLQENIKLAEEIIAREPDSYSAYKAKLISLLTLEGKFQRPLDEDEVNSLLETMASFNVTSDSVSRREAALLSGYNNEIGEVSDRLYEINSQRAEAERLLSITPRNSPDRAKLEVDYYNLVANQQEITERLNELNNSAAESTLSGNTEDVVQVPFYRLLAKNDYDGVIDNARAYIEQFPTSVEGYYFLVRALEESGQHDQANQVIINSKLSKENLNLLQSRLENSEGVDPEDYWQQLHF